MKILQQISTHKAVKENGKINIYVKGFKINDLKFEDELIDTIPLENEDDLFAIFELFEEQNRINRAEFEAENKF